MRITVPEPVSPATTLFRKDKEVIQSHGRRPFLNIEE
jgi:hypothetical protein